MKLPNKQAEKLRDAFIMEAFMLRRGYQDIRGCDGALLHFVRGSLYHNDNAQRGVRKYGKNVPEVRL